MLEMKEVQYHRTKNFFALAFLSGDSTLRKIARINSRTPCGIPGVELSVRRTVNLLKPLAKNSEALG